MRMGRVSVLPRLTLGTALKRARSGRETRSMLSELKFVAGAVAKKDLLPALTHFRIQNGTVRGYNGVLALCSPIQLDLDCAPKAVPLVRAISNCKDTVSLSLTPSGRLSVRSGNFKAFIECAPGETAHVEPTGGTFPIDGEALLKAITTLQPFVCDDLARAWANGVLLRGQSAFATNNVILMEYWLGADFPEMNIPKAAIKEMIRIGEPPISAQADAGSVTFHYPGGRWLRTQLLETNWPDLVKVLNVPSNPVPVDPQIFAGLKTIKPFADKVGRVLFSDGKMATHESPEEGARFDCTVPLPEGVYQIDMLSLLEGVATRADWGLYPKPTMFFGERLRGAVIGMR